MIKNANDCTLAEHKRRLANNDSYVNMLRERLNSLSAEIGRQTYQNNLYAEKVSKAERLGLTSFDSDKNI